MDVSKSVPIDKVPDVETKGTDTDERTGSIITIDGKGDTVVTQEDGESYVIDAAAERRLLWKFDLRILPLLAMMYLFNSLDKSNLGNAKTNGLEKDLGMAGTNDCKSLIVSLITTSVGRGC